MKIQETTRRLIIDELLIHGCVSGYNGSVVKTKI